MSPDDVRAKLASGASFLDDPRSVLRPDARDAAILVPLLFAPEGVCTYVLVRASGLRDHAGEVSFPGGRQDADEDLVGTALREAHEEIGLDPGLVEIVAELDHLVTVSARFALTPYVGLLAARPTLVPDDREVDLVFDVALSELEEELGGKVKNVHFTDVFENGEMTFDYRLRDGVVRTSNALRLLQMAGIDVEADDKLTGD